MTLEELIEESYKLFDRYTIGNTLDVCKRCCVSDRDEAILVNTPLRKITAQQLRSGYFESARSYSDQELLEMKYFLPRVLELVSNFDFPCVSSETVFYRLNLQNKQKWPLEELQLLNDFSALFAKKSLKYHPYMPDGDDISNVLMIFASAYFDLNPFLKVWENEDSLESLLNFKDYVLYSMEYDLLSSRELIEKNTELGFVKQVYLWLNKSEVKANFANKISETLKKNINLDTETKDDFNFILEILKA